MWYLLHIMKQHDNNIRHLCYDYDFSAVEIFDLFHLASRLKKKQYQGIRQELLPGKSLAMIFEKPSTRTRVSFEAAMTQLGGHALYLGPSDLQLSRGETLADTARTLSCYVDGIMARVYRHEKVEILTRHSTVPVINGLSDMYHPCQALTDMYTIWEKTKSLKQITIAFVGDGDNNVTNSLLLLSARLGVGMIVASPDRFKVSDPIKRIVMKEAKKTGAHITFTADPRKAASKADILYTDVWVSMGKDDSKERLEGLKSYQLNSALLSFAPGHCMVMHCLPAHRGQEITNEVIDGKQSIVFDQAENRLHVQKALLVYLLR
jgi:ornithine carbamoyltransferase